MIGLSPRAVPLARRMIQRDAARFSITIAGVGMAIVLVLFLVALYDGVRTEGNGWVSSRPVDAWVAQKGTTNFIKASSILPMFDADSLRADSMVAEVTPLLRAILVLEHGERHATAIFIGLDSASSAGRPDVVEGTSRPAREEVVLDKALARRIGAGVGDTVRMEGKSFRVVGLSRGTNSVLAQLGFMPIEDTRAMLNLPVFASYFLVRAAPRVSSEQLVQEIRSRVPSVAVFTESEFSANNMDELRGGVIPILATIGVLGTIVAIAVLALLLYGSVLERREDYALLKAIGASAGLVARLILAQALVAVAAGLVVGMLAYFVAAPVAVTLAPVVPVALAWQRVALIIAGALIVGAIAALVPLRRLARIDPAEVFRA